MFLGASFRLSAYGGLGRFFTFSLAAPEQLITHGIYRFIQHPAYIGQMLAMVPALGMALTWHGGVGCFVDRDVVQMLYGWSGVVSGVLLAGVVRMMAVRVRDEERMLREKFGDEWIDWNRRTGRVIPGGF